MAKPPKLTLADGTVIDVLYEDRAVIAIDKPAGWMLAPASWDRTGRNLQLALESGIQGGDFWARARNLGFLRFVHRLDAETSGVLLLVKSRGALQAYTRLFETRRVEKLYLAVVHGTPRQPEWTCQLPIAPDPHQPGKMAVAGFKTKRRPAAAQPAKPAETRFRVLKTAGNRTLLAVQPLTGRTHQIRVHLTASACPVVGDWLYGAELPGAKSATAQAQRPNRARPQAPQSKSLLAPGTLRRSPLPSRPASPALALRAIGLAYPDPFTHKPVRIRAPFADFAAKYGFELHWDEVFAIIGRQI